MTIREKLQRALTDRWMPESYAEKTLKEALPAIEGELPLKYDWDRSQEECPDWLFRMIQDHVIDCAKQWIAKNAPHAWFMPMFR